MDKNEFLKVLAELKDKGVNNLADIRLKGINNLEEINRKIGNNSAHITNVGVTESISHQGNAEKINENDKSIMEKASKHKE